MKRFIVLLLCLVLTLSLSTPPFINAENVLTGFYGDLDNDMKVSPSDVKIMNDYMFKGNNSDINSKMDLDENKKINIADLVLLKSCINGETKKQAIYEDDGFTDQATKGLWIPLSSHGNINIPVFFIDFPDYTYENELSCSDIKNKLFGPKDENSPDYPLESLSAYYERSSKGALKMSGNVYKYTARNNAGYYENEYGDIDLINECLLAFEDLIDFNDYDRDNNGIVDTVICAVPHCKDFTMMGARTVMKYDNFLDIDNLTVNKVVEITVSEQSWIKMGLICHELGHAMGLPDYYLYEGGQDSEGMNGPAGQEMMDTGGDSDFSAVSKSLLGWYRKNQIQVFNYSENEMNFTLYSAESDQGNCIIIPHSTPWSPASEYFVIEYQTETGNDSGTKAERERYHFFSSGIRIIHADTGDIKPDSLYRLTNKYGTKKNERRYIRLVNDGEPAFTSGALINNSIPGFGWYNEKEEEAIDPGVSIKINSMDKDKCTVTITCK